MRRASAGSCSQPSGTSSLSTSMGSSTSTGPGLPFFSCEKARRITSGSALPIVSGSAHLVTCCMFRVELKFG